MASDLCVHQVLVDTLNQALSQGPVVLLLQLFFLNGYGFLISKNKGTCCGTITGFNFSNNGANSSVCTVIKQAFYYEPLFLLHVATMAS